MKPSFLGPFGRVFERALGHEILFNPNDFDGLTLWTDTSDPTTIIESGGFISQWSDKSGNGNHLKQAVGASQPSLDGDGSILFNGVNQFLKAVPFTLDQPETIYILFQQVSSTSLATVYDGDIGDRGGAETANTLTRYNFLCWEFYWNNYHVSSWSLWCDHNRSQWNFFCSSTE